MRTVYLLIALHTYRNGGGGSGILDLIIHAAIWSSVSQVIRFLFHEFPALGWIGAAALVIAALVWISRKIQARAGR